MRKEVTSEGVREFGRQADNLARHTLVVTFDTLSGELTEKEKEVNLRWLRRISNRLRNVEIKDVSVL